MQALLCYEREAMTPKHLGAVPPPEPSGPDEKIPTAGLGGPKQPMFDVPVTRAEFLKLPMHIRRRALRRMARDYGKEARILPV